jgi:hypothetical protein
LKVFLELKLNPRFRVSVDIKTLSGVATDIARNQITSKPSTNATDFDHILTPPSRVLIPQQEEWGRLTPDKTYLITCIASFLKMRLKGESYAHWLKDFR